MTLVLLPGLHGTADLFAPLLKFIPPSTPHRVIAYPTNRPWGYAKLLDYITSQTADLDTMLLVAESFSSPLSLMFAAQELKQGRNRIRGIALVAGFVQPAVPPVLCWLGALFSLLPIPLDPISTRLFLCGLHAPSSVPRAARRTVWSVRTHVIARRILAVSMLDAREALRTCARAQISLLYLAGTRDRLVGPRGLRRVLRVAPTIRIEHFQAPHMLLQTHPRETWQALETWAAHLASGPSAIGPKSNAVAPLDHLTI